MLFILQQFIRLYVFSFMDISLYFNYQNLNVYKIGFALMFEIESSGLVYVLVARGSVQLFAFYFRLILANNTKFSLL